MPQWDKNEMTQKACVSARPGPLTASQLDQDKNFRLNICQSLMTKNNKDVILNTIP